jgi:hypothetical protein
MSFYSLEYVNWFAIFVGAVVYFALGGFWYSPAGFGKAWMRSVGMTMPDDGARPGPAIYATPLAGGFVTAIVTAWLAQATGSSTLAHGALLGLAVSIGYMATLALTTATFSQYPSPRTWFLITASYNVVGVTILAIIVSVWQ